METVKCDECGQEVEKRKAGPHKSAHVRQAKAQYVYVGDDKKHPYEWKYCLGCGEFRLIQKRRDCCSRRCSKLGDRNPSKQKASNHGLSQIEYVRAHENVRKVRGKADRCVNGCEGRKMYHWANTSGDYWNPEDYQPMCVPCHDKFDRRKGGE